jgi:DNA methylase N-4/N-6 domain protein
MTPQLAQLIAKLQEIFQINQPDLDFGIYRILNSRQTQINEFLQKTLPNKINAAFNGNFEQANNVYNHLYTFFSRYYDQGDFISQRRYKGDTYAIPYAGEEVMLHWANKDQYYTKSGESFSNYAFTLENGKKVQFRLVEADTAKDNRKDNEQARVFALIEPRIKTETDENGDEIQTDIRPIEENGDLLTIRFEYKAVNKKEKQSDYITQAVEKIQNFAISDEFQGIFDLMPTEKNKNRTLLEKYLTDYTAKNTADYFIHKNLGKFLNQELDFYIKNEVMNLDNIQDSTDFSHIEQNLQTIKTIKTVAKEIIAFLAQLEDFQKKLWLKKKFVAGCHYLITLDHLNEAQVQAALDNPKQTAQWQALFNVNTSGLNVVELCKNYPHLVVDTALFEPTFQADMLNNLHDLDEKTNGLLIHSDNFQALNLLQERYKEQVKCIYIDPPYNTDGDGFMYKDNYQHSSWLTLMKDRGELSRNLLKDNGVFFFSIDEIEVAKSWELFNGIYGVENFSTDFVWQKKKKPSFLHKNIGKLNDYILCYTKNYQNTFPFSVEKTTEGKKTPINNAGNSLAILEFQPNSVRFGISDGIVRAQNMSDGNIITELLDDVIIENGKNKNILRLKGEWRYSQRKVNELIQAKADFYISQIPFRPNHIKDGGEIKKMKNFFSAEHYEMETNEDATAQHANLFDSELFKNPKPEKLINYLIKSVTYDKEKNLILDYFSGSGTTAHAVINLNREDNGNRKYILVEQGEYFDSVLKPRVQKVIFAKEWKEGKPQAEKGAFGGVSQIVKVLKLESYEDTLNNLELKQPASDLFAQHEALQNDYLLHYMLDVESRDSLLNTQHFTKPFDYQLNIATTSAGVYEAKTIDLVETFNYLIGLRVSEINDKRENGLVMVQGINTSGEKTLVIWRDCEKYDYDKLNRYLDSRDINPQDSEFEVVYINGDHNVPTVFTDSDDSVKMLKVRSIEAEFLSKMFG